MTDSIDPYQSECAVRIDHKKDESDVQSLDFDVSPTYDCSRPKMKALREAREGKKGHVFSDSIEKPRKTRPDNSHAIRPSHGVRESGEDESSTLIVSTSTSKTSDTNDHSSRYTPK